MLGRRDGEKEGETGADYTDSLRIVSVRWGSHGYRGMAQLVT